MYSAQPLNQVVRTMDSWFVHDGRRGKVMVLFWFIDMALSSNFTQTQLYTRPNWIQSASKPSSNPSVLYKVIFQALSYALNVSNIKNSVKKTLLAGSVKAYLHGMLHLTLDHWGCFLKSCASDLSVQDLSSKRNIQLAYINISTIWIGTWTKRDMNSFQYTVKFRK